MVADYHPKLQHRRVSSISPLQLNPDPSLFKQLGGRTAIGQLIDGLYDRIESSQQLRPKFVRDLTKERQKQRAFFEEWFGGEALYSQHFALQSLSEAHGHIHINASDAALWVQFFEAALGDLQCAEEAKSEVKSLVELVAFALINEYGKAKLGGHRCERLKRSVPAIGHAAGGRWLELAGILEDQPDLLSSPVNGGRLLFAAARRGRLEVIRGLLSRGAAVNRVAKFHYKVMMTPLCAALAHRRTEAANYLEQAGALRDVFTAAFIDDVEFLRREIREHPELLEAVDPASDFLGVTPLLHAVFGKGRRAALFLLEQGSTAGPLGATILAKAVEKKDVELVKKLLSVGADASLLGIGHWILDPALAGLLLEAGACVDRGDWILHACRAHHGQKDEPEYVRALIENGAKVHARVDGRGALHYAAKAGFVGVISVLVDAGVDLDGRDLDGKTALFYVLKSGRTTNVKAVLTALIDAGAKPELRDNKGHRVVDYAKRSRDPRCQECVPYLEALESE